MLHPELRNIPFSNLLLHSTIIASANVRDDYERDAIRDLQKMPSSDLKDKTRGREKIIKIVSDNRNPNLKLSGNSRSTGHRNPNVVMP